MLKYIIRRILLLIPVMFGVSVIVFSLLYFTPGDPVRNKLGTNASPEEVLKLREKMGLNDPFLVQFGRYLKNIVFKGSLGESYITEQPVVLEIGARVGATIRLAVASTIVAICLGIPLGIISAIKQYSVFDHITMVFALIGLSMPVFWLGLLMILLFSVKLGWFPSSGFSGFKHMVLPALALGAQSVAVLTRMTRSSMLETIRQDYIRTARAKGQKEKIVIFKHALGNSLIPVITIVGIQFGQLMGGAVMTEIIFSIPGIGRLMIDSIKLRDAPVVLGCVLFVAVTFAIVNLIVDILYTYVDPRIKTQYT
ncbi:MULTISPECIES: nickel ABC transporter permease [unclassified Treponema]|uniref:nickel ABC transporter permease n=1 Tax=unclassified Treponema TaxID=2638727 RepID=UPI0020A57ADE|nr:MULTISPECIES: nickel ABC transporter permease [unclassified Treponema]UTC68080.1 ABC transporter permease [Treponema sp. OMZ 789]UTC70802.1 ABC transporter permease [Treponema sp. OMZ 790]UTC73542.1 ABC transporter permease [Treponema sp. OMZ 791]